MVASHAPTNPATGTLTGMLTTALASGDVPAALTALMALERAVTGARLVTLMEYDAQTGESARIATNAPEVYPLGGRKPLPANRWTDLVIHGRRDWVANSPEEVAGLLFDHETIAALGCGACLNMVLAAGGQVLGTLNLLNPAGAWTPNRLQQAEALRLPALALLLARRLVQVGSTPAHPPQPAPGSLRSAP